MKGMPDLLEKYSRLQFCARFQPNFRGDFLHFSEIPDSMREFDYMECYASSFLYSEGMPDYVANNRISGKPSISGYDGPIWATYFFNDIDSKDLDKSLLTAREMVSFLIEKWELPYESVLVYFSGCSGYHIMVEGRAFGSIPPSSDLNVIFAAMRRGLPNKAKVTYPETVDQSIGDKQRIIRLPDTTNTKSGLRKIQLTIPEVFELTTERIKDKAKKKQPLYFTDLTGIIPTEHVKQNSNAVEFYKLAQRTIRGKSSQVKKVQISQSFPDSEDPIKQLCPARQGLWFAKIEEEYRHNSAIRLVAQFRLLGVNKDRSKDLIFFWNRKNQIDLPEDELKGIVKYVYAARTPYAYGCSYEKLQEFCPYQDKSKCGYYKSHLV